MTLPSLGTSCKIHFSASYLGGGINCGVGDEIIARRSWLLIYRKMSLDSRSRSKSRSRSPMDHKLSTQRYSNRDAPYRRESRRGFRTNQQVGHMSRDCISMALCHNCGGRGRLAFECSSGRFMDRYPRRY